MKDTFLISLISMNVACLSVLTAEATTRAWNARSHTKAPCEMCEPTACETSLECEANCGCVKPAGAPFGWCVSYPE